MNLKTLTAWIALYASQVAAEEIDGTGGSKVDFVGASGQMKLCPTGDCSAQFIKVKMDKIEELNPDGGVAQKVTSFASQNFTWSDPTTVTVEGEETTEVSFESELAVGDGNAQFKLTTVMTPRDIEIPYGNSTVSLQSGALKFTLEVTDWPFEDPVNVLSFGVDIQTKNSGAATEENGGGNVKVDLGDGLVIEGPAFAIVDGEQADVETVLDAKSNKVSYSWVFPSFESTLVYDPVIRQEDSNSGSAPTVALSVFTAFVTSIVHLF